MTLTVLTERPTSLLTAPPEDATRRELITGVGAAALAAVFLAACGDGDGEEATTSPASEFVTVRHQFGETQVPTSPQRVATVGYTENEWLLSFGVRPISYRYHYGDQPFGTWPWAQEALGDAEPVRLDAELDFELIASLEPDLITATWGDLTQAEYDQLSQIAPTVGAHPDIVEREITWEEHARHLGVIFGMEERADEMIAEVPAKMTEVREAHPEWEGKTAIFAIADPLQAYPSSDGRGEFLERLGFVIPEAFNEAVEASGSNALSPEQLSMIDVDVLVWMAWDGRVDTVEALDLRTPSERTTRDGRRLPVSSSPRPSP